MPDKTYFERQSLKKVLESFLYTSDNMFGEIVCDAERELYKRTPPPPWATNKDSGLPTLAKAYWNEDGTPKVEAKLPRKRRLARAGN